MRARGAVAATGLLLLLLAGGSARADLQLKLSGHISSDIRYRLLGKPVASPYPSQYGLLRYGFSRNENRVRNQLVATVGDKVKAVADVELVYYGYSDVHDIDSLTLRERVDPYFFEAHAAYVDIYRVLPGLDLRIGRQTVHWGASDLFNPTSNLNTLDFSDPLLFGRALANNMVRADWSPTSRGDFTITAVWVPIFRPAQLPRTAPLALDQADRPAPVEEEAVRRTLGTLATVMTPSRIDVTGLAPEASLANSQLGVRVAGKLLDQDASLSYYHGRFGIPSPAWTINHPDQIVEVGVVWPKMDVVGADLAGSLGFLGGAGYWLEGALVFPQEITYAIYNDDPKFGGRHQQVRFDAAGHLSLDGSGRRPVVVPATPFFKVTVGADYSVGEHLYFNLQYLHGFIDEFGAGMAARLPAQPGDAPRVEHALGDYLVGGVDVKLVSSTLLVRLFGVLKLPTFDASGRFDDYRATGVLFPQIAWQAWDATELDLGAFVFLGDRSTKFGDPSTGASELFAKAKFTY